jgi:hypothetical protein
LQNGGIGIKQDQADGQNVENYLFSAVEFLVEHGFLK